MHYKVLINDYFIPGIIWLIIAQSNSIRISLLQISASFISRYEYLIDYTIHFGTAFSVVLGCIYWMIKIWLAIKHKKG